MFLAFLIVLFFIGWLISEAQSSRQEKKNEEFHESLRQLESLKQKQEQQKKEQERMKALQYRAMIGTAFNHPNYTIERRYTEEAGDTHFLMSRMDYIDLILMDVKDSSVILQNQDTKELIEVPILVFSRDFSRANV